jgi:L-lactate dehydrogenase
LEQWPGFGPNLQREVFEDTKTSGAQVIKLKGGSGFAVGLSIREVVHSILLDSRRVLPVSTLMNGAYGIKDVCLSVPTVVGCGGARQQIELPLTMKERMGLQQSAKVLRETIDQVEKRVGTVRAQVSGGEVLTQNGVGTTNGSGRVVPRSAWQGARS